MIIDAHVHIGPSEKFRRNWSLTEYSRLMSQCNIDHAIIMPNISSNVSAKDANDTLMQEYLTFPLQYKLSILLLVDPFSMSTSNQFYRWNKVVSGIKYHPSVYQTEVSSPILTPFIEQAKLYDVPVLVHCGRNGKSHVKHVVDVASRYPSVNFIAAHLGGNASELIEEALDIVASSGLANIYLDTSAVKLPSQIKQACNIFSDKILFGSDEPYGDLNISVACIEYADLTEEVKQNVFSNTARKLFKNIR